MVVGDELIRGGRLVEGEVPARTAVENSLVLGLPVIRIRVAVAVRYLPERSWGMVALKVPSV
jgi:hypothetical protein